MKKSKKSYEKLENHAKSENAPLDLHFPCEAIYNIVIIDSTGQTLQNIASSETVARLLSDFVKKLAKENPFVVSHTPLNSKDLSEWKRAVKDGKDVKRYLDWVESEEENVPNFFGGPENTTKLPQ